MKRYLLLFMAALYLLVPTVCMAGIHDYPNIAVLPFANKAVLSRELDFRDPALISEFVIEELIDSERFNVMEREQLMALTDEYNLNMSGLVDPSSAAQVGKLAGVQYMVYGSVTGLTTKESGISYDNSMFGGAGGSKHTVIANVTARIIEVETGRIIVAGRGTGKSASTHMEFRLNVLKDTPYETTGYDAATGEEYIMEGQENSVLSHKVTIGTEQVSMVQMHNAIAKAVTDAIYGDFGLITKMDGKGKKRFKER